MPTPSGTTKAEKFRHHQLRSVLDDGKVEDEPWENMRLSGLCQAHAEVNIHLLLPSSEEAEASLLSGVEHLSDAFKGSELPNFHKRFGWSNWKEYFGSMGETQVMLVDVDHNDSDDRLAIILLAFQVASANLERRQEVKDARARILLDGRTYETGGGLTLWRTLQLATRLTEALEPHGVDVQPVVTDTAFALQLISSYLKVQSSFDALNSITKGTGNVLRSLTLQDLREVRGNVSVWILSGLCKKQVEDFSYCQKKLGTKFTFIEQAQPAWQSMDCTAAEVQPGWTFPPAFGDEKGFGVEPSNVRSSEAPYTETLSNYLRFQQLVAPEAKYVCPALARSNAFLPVPAGQKMLAISGRPFNVIPGKAYVIKKALNPDRAQNAFGKLLESAKAYYAENLLPELCIDSCDDFGAERPELAAVVKYGTFLADVIVVCLAARPQLPTQLKRRRLALALVPKPGEDPVMTFQVRRLAERLDHLQEALEEKANSSQLKEIVREAWNKEEGHLGRLQKLCESKVSIGDFASLAAVAEGKASLADVDATVQRQVQRRLQCLITDQRLVSHAEVAGITEAALKDVKERLKDSPSRRWKLSARIASIEDRMAGLSTSRSSPSLREDGPTYLIPSCYASHKALSKTYLRAPGLFSGQGMRLLGEMEKYRPAEMRNQSLESKAYLRRQLLLPEVEGIRKSMATDIWTEHNRPKWAGSTLEVIHRDIR
eukprot:symbB.v1.2.012999.t1/scaffold912.1/size152940/5